MIHRKHVSIDYLLLFYACITACYDNFTSYYKLNCYNLAKVEVAGSNPVSRSKEFKGLAIRLTPFFLSTV